MQLRKILSARDVLIKRRVKQVIDIVPSHWFHLKDKSIVPDVTYTFYQTLYLKYGIYPKNKTEVKLIRETFHDIYINEYKGVYKLDLEKTFTSPITSTIGIKYLKYYENFVTHTKNVSLHKRLKLIRKKKK